MPEAGLSVGELLHHSVVRLRAAGLPEPAREARRLWEGLGVTPRATAFDLMEGGRILEPDLAAAVDSAVSRRVAGEPLPYVTGSTGFRRLSLRCDQRALIPRPETEGLVDHLFRVAPSGRVADIGTGSGCIALSLADEGSYDLVVGLDRFPAALALAAENRALTGLPITLVRGDLSQALRGATFDALVANPPYLTAAEGATVDPSVGDWEPASALVSGVDGLEATRRLLATGIEVVRPGGWIAVEVDCNRATDTATLAGRLGWTEVSVHDDLFGRARYLLARRSPTG
ncbi:MAG: N5-glutamine methyltransferase family protein [Gemmatimonadales bacterium]